MTKPEPFYRMATAEENDIARAQLREGNRMAREVVMSRGVKVHPRLAALRADQTTPDQSNTQAA